MGPGHNLLAPNPLIASGLGAGLGYRPLTDTDAVWIGRLPDTAALATGATFTLFVADDPNNPDPGKVARFTVTVKKLAGGTDVLDETGMGTETAGTITLPATAGIVQSGAIAIVVANLDGVAAGDWVLIRVRRTGTNSADTHRGRVVLLAVDVRDT
jgi:hypothetical protein